MKRFSDLQESFQLEAARTAAKAGTIEGVSYRENSLEDVSIVRVG